MPLLCEDCAHFVVRMTCFNEEHSAIFSFARIVKRSQSMCTYLQFTIIKSFVCPQVHIQTQTHIYTFYIHIDQHDMHGKYTYIWTHIFHILIYIIFPTTQQKPHTINMILILRCQHISINSTPNITLHVSCALLRASRHRGSTSQPVTSAFNASWTCKPHVGRENNFWGTE